MSEVKTSKATGKSMEVGEENTLYLQLHKLNGAKSEESLDQLLIAIWQSRKTGLHDKTHFQSLLNLPSLSDLDTVLVCLRSLIRKWVYDNEFTGDDLVKLFPRDLPLDLQQSLVLLFHKYQNLWKEDASRDERSLPRKSFSYNVRTSTAPTITPFPSSNVSGEIWPRHDNEIAHFDRSNVNSLMPVITEKVVAHHNFFPAENLGILPSLKSMSWSMENCDSDPSKRVAVISLKLQDYTNSHLGETEVKFRLTRDTLEAMLRSMTYINDQVSGTVGSEPAHKKQRQSDNSS